jgi:SNF2 family DNA or RNA helicase
MTVRRYRTLDEMNRDIRLVAPGDPSIPRRMQELWQLSEQLLGEVGTCVPRGVRKYRSVEEANADREQWERERVRRLQARKRS